MREPSAGGILQDVFQPDQSVVFSEEHQRGFEIVRRDGYTQALREGRFLFANIVKEHTSQRVTGPQHARHSETAWQMGQCCASYFHYRALSQLIEGFHHLTD